jgi:hypothetical protein
MQKFDMERFNLKKLDEVEGKEQYRVEISNRFAASRSISHGLPGCSQLLDQRTQAKL